MRQPGVGGRWFLYFRDNPSDHPGITREELDALPNRGVPEKKTRPRVPWRALTRRMLPVTIVYFCYGWTLWLYLTWLPSYFLHEYQYDLKKSALFTSAVFFAGVVGDYLGGVVSDRILHRTGNLQKARRNVVMLGFAGSFVCLLPVFLTHDLFLIILSLGAAFFFAELVIGPMWSIPMDIAGKFSGTPAGMMNTGSALAAILSPIAFGYIIDAPATGSCRSPARWDSFCSAQRSRPSCIQNGPSNLNWVIGELGVIE